ncbi:MAG: YegS/Rv2252/BmrU family lipid kinase [Ruminococcaceae bacterium]|nr:YegS/Rv2252/BmrU family lipid kinase [Oscillospiraceae bacterium]
MRDVYIINPAAGQQDGTEKLTNQIKEVYKDNCKILVTSGKNDALKMAKAEAETGDEVRIFACGGDGTCFEVLNGIVGYPNVSIGVIPIGSANDFIKYFGFDSKPQFLNIENQKNGTIMPIDLIKAGDYYCMNQCCAGLDALVAERMQSYKRLPLVSGSMAYNIALVRTFLGKLGINMKVTADGKPFGQGSFLFAICANAPVYGGGYISAPNADISDGKLDCLTIDTVSKLKFLKLLPLYKNGKHEAIDVCHMDTCRSFEFEADREIPVSLDGEIIHTNRFICEIIEKGMNFVVPAGVLKTNY